MTTDTILLVEDDENDAFFVERAMHKIGMTNPVRNARDGQEAIDYLSGAGKFARRADFPLPGLILLDLKLPLVMGLAVLKWIRENSGLSVIVIILSSSAEPSDLAAAYRLGANAYLVKPAASNNLEGMVRAINDFWLLQNTPPASSPPASWSVERGAPAMRDFRNRGLDVYEHSSVTGSGGRVAANLYQADL
jgi:two-component system response regulator